MGFTPSVLLTHPDDSKFRIGGKLGIAVTQDTKLGIAVTQDTKLRIAVTQDTTL